MIAQEGERELMASKERDCIEIAFAEVLVPYPLIATSSLRTLEFSQVRGRLASCQTKELLPTRAERVCARAFAAL